MAEPVWFWQRIVSPHMAGLAEELAALGRDVVYVAERPMSEDRSAQGWRAPPLVSAKLAFAPSARSVERLVATAPENSIHICQGLRANALVGRAQTLLGRRGLRQWVIMETVDDAGWRQWLKRTLYRNAIACRKNRLDGILAIGHATPGWIAARGMREADIVPFAYFLSPADHPARAGTDRPFTILFVGRLIALKRVDLLLRAFENIGGNAAARLVIVGAGPSEAELRKLPGATSAKWRGQVDGEEARTLMASADCLVLPSRHDGWGAVVSEALMAGTRVICSEGCGAAGVVQASGAGSVFIEGDAHSLVQALRSQVSKGRQPRKDRESLAEWSRCLNARAGARYLDTILSRARRGAAMPLPPWCAGGDDSREAQ